MASKSGTDRKAEIRKNQTLSPEGESGELKSAKGNVGEGKDMNIRARNMHLGWSACAGAGLGCTSTKDPAKKKCDGVPWSEKRPKS